MTGTPSGGKLAEAQNKKRYGSDFYKRIGAAGGRAGRGHKFAHGKLTPSEVGKLGGRPKGHVPANKQSDSR